MCIWKCPLAAFGIKASLPADDSYGCFSPQMDMSRGALKTLQGSRIVKRSKGKGYAMVKNHGISCREFLCGHGQKSRHNFIVGDASNKTSQN